MGMKKKIGKLARGVARVGLPIVGGIVGGPVGGAIGGALGNAIGSGKPKIGKIALGAATGALTGGMAGGAKKGYDAVAGVKGAGMGAKIAATAKGAVGAGHAMSLGPGSSTVPVLNASVPWGKLGGGLAGAAGKVGGSVAKNPLAWAMAAQTGLGLLDARNEQRQHAGDLAFTAQENAMDRALKEREVAMEEQRARARAATAAQYAPLLMQALQRRETPILPTPYGG